MGHMILAASWGCERTW